MRIYTVAIVDDEIDSQITLRSFLEEYCPFIELTGTYNSVKDCIDGLKQKAPDILLLDISLSDGTGFDILQRTSAPDTKIIMITAHSHYAVEAFKYKVDDYLLKPVNPKDLQKSITDLLKSMDEQSVDVAKNNRVLINLKKLGIPSKDKLHITTLNNIVRCEADSNYTIVFLNDESRIIVPKTIKIFEETLGESGFIRVHQSHLINEQHINTVLLRKSRLCLKTGEEIPISRKYKSQVVNKFKLKFI